MRRKNSTPSMKYTPSAKMHGVQTKINISIYALKMIFIAIEMSICIYYKRQKKESAQTRCVCELKQIFTESVIPRHFHNRYSVRSMWLCVLSRSLSIRPCSFFLFASFSFCSLSDSDGCDICAQKTVIRWDTTDYLTIIYVSSYL